MKRKILFFSKTIKLKPDSKVLCVGTICDYYKDTLPSSLEESGIDLNNVKFVSEDQEVMAEITKHFLDYDYIMVNGRPIIPNVINTIKSYITTHGPSDIIITDLRIVSLYELDRTNEKVARMIPVKI